MSLKILLKVGSEIGVHKLLCLFESCPYPRLTGKFACVLSGLVLGLNAIAQITAEQELISAGVGASICVSPLCEGQVALANFNFAKFY